MHLKTFDLLPIHVILPMLCYLISVLSIVPPDVDTPEVIVL